MSLGAYSWRMGRILVLGLLLTGCGYSVRIVPAQYGPVMADIEASLAKVDSELPSRHQWWRENLVTQPGIDENDLKEIRIEGQSMNDLIEEQSDATGAFKELRKALDLPVEPRGNLDLAGSFGFGALLAALVALAV